MMTTTIVSSRVNTRAEVSLAMPSPTVEDDNSTSPHLSTLQVANEKAKITDTPPVIASLSAMRIEVNLSGPAHHGHGDGDGSSPEPQTQDVNESGHKQGESATAAPDPENVVAGSASQDEPPSYIPAHLDLRGPRRNGHHSGHTTPTGCGSGRSSGRATPTSYGQLPSSSIPHLLSTSAEQQMILSQSQLSFVGIDASLTATIRSRDPSIAFSLDGDDSTLNINRFAPTPPQIGQICTQTQATSQQQLTACLKQGLTSPLEANGSGSHSSLSLPSVVSPCHGTPLQGSQEPPASATSPVKIRASLEQQVAAINAEVGKILLGGEMQHATKPPPLPVTVANRHPMPSVVQPVLYSAISSLERYNAGSFDNNKVMLAKARGTYGTQSAFPGVPTKKAEQPMRKARMGGLGTSIESSVSSFGRKGPVEDGEERIRRGHDREDNALIDRVGEEHLVAITDQPSEGRLIKSKSSGNLDDKGNGETPESLGLAQKGGKGKVHRSVTIDADEPRSRRRDRRREKKVGVFRPSSDACTPRLGDRDLKYKPAAQRAPVEKMSSTMGTIQRPNFRDALRRVAIILQQHIVKIERRFETGKPGVDDTGLFRASMREEFREENFATPRYKCSMVRVPMARPGVVYSMRRIRAVHDVPTADEIYEFAHQLFKKVQLSSECSIVCLIYVEKLMEVAKVPLVTETWRPIFMCGLLLASKVWQDLSSWNIEFASVYPQFSLDAINRLELLFLKFIKWDLYISSSLYAKYYFALRSLLEKSGFRDRYNQMVGGIGGIAASEAMKISKRSEAVKEEALQQLSRSM